MREAKWGWGKTRAMFAAIVISSACLGVASIASAGAAPGAASVDDLKSTIEQLKQTVNALEQKMAVMEESQAATNKQVEEVVKGGGSSTAGLITPKDTTMTLYGYAKLDAIWTDTSPNSPGTYFYLPSTVPLDGDNVPDNQFIMHARQTRLGLLTSTPTDYGTFKVRFEGDFYGGNSSIFNDWVTNSYVLRLRRAYGELGNFLAGQEWSTFIDLKAFPEFLDFAGPAGNLSPLRQGLIRWTQPLDFGSFQISAENPSSRLTYKTQDAETGTWSNTTVWGNNEYVPDIVARLNVDAGYGHYSIIGMARHFSYDDGQYSESTWGGTLGLNAVIPTVGKDNIHLSFYYGSIGRYMNALYADAFINPVTHEIETYQQVGGYVDYQHFWMESLRSSIMYSLTQADNDLDYVTNSLDKQYQSVHANLIWSPIPRINIGMEYIYGYRKTEADKTGDMNRLMASFVYKF